MTTLTVQADGYNDGTGDVTVGPSGFIIWSPNSIDTTTFATNGNVQIRSMRLNSGTLASAGSGQRLRAGLSVDVVVTSSNTDFGEITVSPVNFSANEFNDTTQFDPDGIGTTDISLQTPAGWDTPSNNQQITATVTAPDINVTNKTVGEDLQVSLNVTLESAPPSPVDVTVTSSSAAVATLTTDPLVEGTSNVTFTNVTSTNVGTLLVQRRAQGSSTTLTVQTRVTTTARPRLRSSRLVSSLGLRTTSRRRWLRRTGISRFVPWP